ncbi:MAG TPA: ABC transporter ATP-binding protein [Rugosimonospora sp.]|nr:ABC transporter ATP-binding protein [Rugosimonospora sp.]
MNRYCVGPTMAVDWGEDGPPPAVRRAMLRRVLSYFGPYRGRGLVVVGCIAVQAVLGLAPAVVFKSLIDTLAHPHPAFTRVGLLVGAGIAAALAGGLVGVAQSWLSTVISQGIVATLRGQLFEALLAQPVGFFTGHKAGDLLSRIDNDIDGVEDVVTDTVFGLISNALVTAATLALMLAFSWPLTLAVLVLIPLVGLPTRRAGRATYTARARTQRQRATMSAYLQEILGISGIMLVKAFGAAPAEHARFGRINRDLRALEVRQHLIGQWFRMLMNTLQTAGPALMILFGGWLVVAGHATVGTVFVFATVLGARLAGAVTSLAGMHVNITGSLALFGRLFVYTDRRPEVADAPDARELTEVGGGIRLDRVTFTYPDAPGPAVDDLTVDIAPGQLVALVGPSGAGKTTVTALLARFADPQAGRILIDGTDLRHATLASWTARLGMVFQDTFLFHASIADNLRYARPGASDDDLVAAARTAYLHEFITTLPDGYGTVVGERGHRLSGGEKQRVAIARVILRDPRVLILDEATSNLDSESEHHIQAALRPLLHGRTAIVIAHRLSTILAADQILVLDHGRLLDAGTHTELLARGGLYARLYERQFRTQALAPTGTA